MSESERQTDRQTQRERERERKREKEKEIEEKGGMGWRSERKVKRMKSLILMGQKGMRRKGRAVMKRGEEKEGGWLALSEFF